MKKFIAAAVAASAFIASPALAQNVSSGNTLTFNLDADVGVVCGIYSTTGTSVPVALGDLANLTSTESASFSSEAVYRCNSAAGFTRTVTSANNGTLARAGNDVTSANAISYRYSQTPTGLSPDRNLIDRSQPLSRAVTATHAGSQAFLTGAVAMIGFEVSGVYNRRGGFANGAPGTTVFAGDYTDTVTISVNAL